MGTNYWHTPNHKKWEHMSRGEKVATMLVGPPMLVGFLYMMGQMFYYMGYLVWLAANAVFEIILAIIKGVM